MEVIVSQNISNNTFTLFPCHIVLLSVHIVMHRSVDSFHLYITKTMYLMWHHYIYSFIYLNNGKTYRSTTIYIFLKLMTFENADLILYHTFILFYVWETWLNIYSNFRIIAKDILNLCFLKLHINRYENQ